MASKLFDIDRPVIAVSSVVQESHVSLNDDFVQLERQVFGYNSVGRVYDAIAQESLVFVDEKNVVLYNEYVSVLAMRMGVDAPKRMSVESLSEDGIVVANNQIAIEGWMGDIWNKIKETIKKIYTKIKDFFSKYFTRLGKIKTSLQNLEKVLGTVSKDLGDPSLDNPPEALLKAFAGQSEVNSSGILSSISNIQSLIGKMKVISEEAKYLNDNAIKDQELLQYLNEVKKINTDANASLDDNAERRKQLKMFGDREKKKEIAKDNKTLTQVANKTGSEINEGTDRLAAKGDAVSTDKLDENKEKAVEYMKVYYERIVGVFAPMIGKVLVNGTKFKAVSSDAEKGLQFEMEENVPSAETLKMSNKEEMSRLVKASIALMTLAEKEIKDYGKVNDLIMDSLNRCDKIVAEVDKLNVDKLGKYKATIGQYTRHILTLQSQITTSYNKVCKNVFEMSMDVCEHTVNYCVLSLKHFK